MTDLEPILALWRDLEDAGVDYVLATIVAVEGSSYRRPGAHMLLAHDGRRTGTVSGGCLESEVAKRAWWLTENGPALERFSTIEEDGERPYGSGCGGVVHLLLERRQTAAPLLMVLQRAFNNREPVGIATILDGDLLGRREFSAALRSTVSRGIEDEHRIISGAPQDPIAHELRDLAELALETRTSLQRKISTSEGPVRAWADYRRARPGLWIFGGGDDAKPLLRLAKELGWFVAVADGRSHLAACDRFHTAHLVAVLDIGSLPGPEFARFDLRPTDAAVVMTHSFEQDSAILASLLALNDPPAYIGALGPQRRTRELLAEAARLLHLPDSEDRVDRWLAAIHAPTGLDVGAETPAAIALSILAEIQRTLNHASGEPLRIVRAAKIEIVGG
jgi:xanthine dehydrogenase accessory factor